MRSFLHTFAVNSETFAWIVVGALTLLSVMVQLQRIVHAWRSRPARPTRKCPPNWPPITRAGLLLFVLPLIGCEEQGDPHAPQSLYEWPLQVANLCSQCPNWFLWFAILIIAACVAAVCIAAMHFAYGVGWREGKRHVMRHFVMRTAEFDVQDHKPARFEDHTGIKPRSCAADPASAQAL